LGVSKLRYWVWSRGFGVRGLRFRVQRFGLLGFGFSVSGFVGFGVVILRFGGLGSGLRFGNRA